MSFDSLLRHTAQVWRAVAVLDGGERTYDTLGQPITEPELQATIKCQVTPATAREIEAYHQAGAAVSTHRIFMRPTDLRTADWLVIDGQRYDVNTINDAAGRGHHYEVLATLVVSDDVPEPATS